MHRVTPVTVLLPLFALAVFLSLSTTGCSPAAHDAILASIGKNSITMSEYEKQYLKNSTTRADAAKTTLDERERFLDLLVNYHLKLNDAYREGLNRRPDITGELEQYKGNLAASFLTEREIVAPGIRRLYDQRSQEIRASHILITLTTNASPADSAAAYRKAYMLIDSLHRGASFDSLALHFSNDPSAKTNYGDLYYFTAGNMVPQFEEAAYAMKVGEISPAPVRTQYGLHIIKIIDRKPSSGEIRCSHIMIQFPRTNPAPQDTVIPFQKITLVKDSLNAGIDFAELAKRNSTDGGSASKGGDLGWFARRRWVLPFDEVAFQLKPGQVSPIIRTAYGYHIIKCMDARPPKTFDEAKDEIKQIYQQTRFKKDFADYVNGLKTRYHVRMVDSTVAQCIASCDTTKTTSDSDWASSIAPELGRRPMILVDNSPVSTDSVISIVKGRPDLANTPLRAPQLRTLFDKVAEHLVFSHRAESLALENPEFASIIRDYQDGMLLYQIEQERVWNRIHTNDSLLHVYFDAHRDRFTFPDRLSITELRSGTEANMKEVYKRLKAGATMEEFTRADSVRMSAPLGASLKFTSGSATLSAASKKSLAAIGTEVAAEGTRITITAHPDTTTKKAAQEALATRRLNAVSEYLQKTYTIPPTRITVSTRPLAPKAENAKVAAQTLDADIVGRIALVVGKPATTMIPVKSDERANAADTLAVGSISSPMMFKGSWLIVRLNGREPARQKTYEEAGPEVSSAFQEAESKRLESDWLNGLRGEYAVVEHKEFLKDAFAPQQ